MRRAFTYVANENWGLVRIGQADGVIGIFDNGVTTGQFLINGFGGGDLNGYIGNAAVPFFFLSTQGAEYDNTKLVYLSPQIAGFDFGLQWAPNSSNGYGVGNTGGGIGNSITGSGIGTGLACGHSEFRMPEPVVRPGHPGRLENSPTRPCWAFATRAFSAAWAYWAMPRGSIAAPSTTPG